MSDSTNAAGATAPAEAPHEKLVGRHFTLDAVREFATLLHEMWCVFQREGRKRGTYTGSGAERLLQIPSYAPIGWMHLVNLLHDRKRLHRDVAIRELVELMSQPSRARMLATTVLDLISFLSGRMEAIREDALDERAHPDYQERRRIWAAYNQVERSFLALCTCRLLHELPNTPRAYRFAPSVAERVATEMIEQWAILTRALGSEKYSPGSKEALDRARGSRLFDGVRALEESRKEPTVARLAQWLRSPAARHHRSLPADLAQGLHDLAVISRELRIAASRHTDAALAEEQRLGARTVWLVVVKMIKTGVFIHLPI